MNKGSIVLKNVLAVTSVSLTLPKNVCFAFVVRVKQYVACCILSYLFQFWCLKIAFETRPLHYFFSYYFIYRGSLVRYNISFFQRHVFLKSSIDSYFELFKRWVPQLELNAFQRLLIKLHLKISYNFDNEYVVFD